MEKYFAVISNSIKKNLAYRSFTFIMMASVLLSFGILFYFWSSIYRQGNQIGGYSLNQIITYYVFIAIFEMLFTANTAWGIGEEIKTGQITNSVLKPIKYLEYKLSQSIGSLIYRILFTAPLILLIVYFMSSFLAQPKSSHAYALFFIAATLSYFLNFLVYFVIGILGFWMIDNSGFFYACFVLISFLQGQWLPLDLLPWWFTVINNFLPFKYLFFVPVGIASGRTEFNVFMILIPFGWCLLLYFLGQLLYKKGIKKYEGYGV